MTTRHNPSETFFQRKASVVSEVDSDYLQFKEEFEKKEQEYRKRIHTLKKEVSLAKESLNKMGGSSEMTDSKYGGGRGDTMYTQLDDEVRQKVILRDVKIALLKEHIDKAKAKQMEILKGPLRRVRPDSEQLLNLILVSNYIRISFVNRKRREVTTLWRFNLTKTELSSIASTMLTLSTLSPPIC